jgi:hypothetical protein
VATAAAAALLAAGCGSGTLPVRASSRGQAIEVPGLGALNKGAGSSVLLGVFSVSCGSSGNCAAGGGYRDGDRHEQGFVVSEKNGRWGQAIEIPGSGALNKGHGAQVSTVSCASAGNCAAGGGCLDRYGHGRTTWRVSRRTSRKITGQP